MKQLISLAAVAALAGSAPAHAANYAMAGVVTRMFNYTDLHAEEAARGITMIQLSNPLEGGCVWGYLGSTDKTALAMLLAAKAEGSTIRLTYDNAAHPSWNATVCAVIAVDATT